MLALGAVAWAASVRFAFNDWDGLANLHPDERHMARAVAAIERPAAWLDYLDADTSSLNPRYRGIDLFVYGDLPVNLVRLAAESLADLCVESMIPPGAVARAACFDAAGRPVAWTGIDGITRLGRWLSSLFAVLSVVLTGLITWRLVGAAAGVLALWLAGSVVLTIQLSNFFTVDVAASAFVLAAFLGVIGFRDVGRTWPAMLFAGFAIGAAAACKITLLSFAIVPFAAAVAAALAAPGGRAARMAGGVAVVTLGLYAGVRLLSPSLFDGWFGLDERWVEDIRVAQALVGGAIDYPPGVQWTGRVPWLFPLHNLATWGMGIPLAIAAWSGWVAWGFCTARRLKENGETADGVRDPTGRAMALAWLWIVFAIAWQGGQWVATSRYLLPVYGFLVLFAAWGLSRAWQGGGNFPAVRRAVVGVVIGLSFAWTFAFLGIFAPPHPRLAASDWMAAHLEPGAVIGYEYWDDPLPLGNGGASPAFDRVALDLYAEDTPAKRERIVDQLASIDYLVLSSNRLVASIPRQPMRYPMTTRYYAALVSGSLGFEPVADFAAWPRLGPLVFPDQAWPVPPAVGPGQIIVALPPAEEAFSVYDHPRVIIYRKRTDFSTTMAMRALSVVDVEVAYHGFLSRAESAAPTGLLFTPDQWRQRERASAQPGAARDGPVARHVLAWLAVTLLLGWLATPVVARLAPGLADAGVSLARVFAVVAVSLVVWLAASAGWAANTAYGAYGAVALLGVVALWSWRSGARSRRSAILVGRRRWLVSEAVFLVAFLVALIVRAGTPELWHSAFGGEKPMDFAYFNAVLVSPVFPPHDPWFALGTLNYYYFGFVMASVLTKLAAVPAPTAYNLALALWFALLCQAAYGIGSHLSSRLADGRPGFRPVAGGLLAALFTGLAGNLVQVANLVRGECSPSSGDSCLFWDASRAIATAPGEDALITEFPFFTLLYGDLHAHFLSLPVLLLAIGLALAGTGVSSGARDVLVGIIRAGVVGAVIAVLYMTNTWDAPVAFALVAALLVVAVAQDAGARAQQAKRAILSLVVVIGVATWVLSPYVEHFATDYGRLAWWRGSRTPLSSFLLVHGAFLFPLVAAWWLGPRVETSPAGGVGEVVRYFAAGVGATLAVLLLLGTAPAALVVLPLLVITWLAWRRRTFDAPFACLMFIGLGLAIAVEFVRMDGDVGRMNTVFKFYYHAWVLLALSAAVLVPRLWYLAGRRGPAVRAVVRVPLLVLIGCAMAYPLFAVPAKWSARATLDDRWQLDGAAYLRQPHAREPGRIQGPDGDLAAMQWLRHNAGPVDVVAEGASTTAYTWGGRISAYTGRPTIIGWLVHQQQQKSILPRQVVDRRADDVDALYGSGDAATVRRILARYHVAYLVVGGWERAHYDATSLAVFEQLAARGELIERFRRDSVVIYEVADRAPLEASVLQPLVPTRE